MIYTTELATLKMKATVLEHILCDIESKEEQITRYLENEDQDNWYTEQIQRMRLEIASLEAIMKQISK